MSSPSSEQAAQSGRGASRARAALIIIASAGGLVIAGIGFIGSYSAVQQLAAEKGFGNFSRLYPLGVDAGIVVLLSLDLLLSWMRIPFPLLRQTAWLLTAATIAFNAASAYPDPLAVGMHAVIPVLFVVTVEAARHAIGRIAQITAGAHMESVRLARWILAPWPTFKLWRRMKLFELRDYETVIKLEQERLIYQARLHARYGRAWRRKAPIEALLPLKFARYGAPLGASEPQLLAAAPAASSLTEADPAPAPADHTAVETAGDPGGHTEKTGAPPTADAPLSVNGGDHLPLPAPDGRTAVRNAYAELPGEDRAKASARELAERLSPRLGLSENTVRVYINDLRKELRRRAAVSAPGDGEDGADRPSAEPLTAST